MSDSNYALLVLSFVLCAAGLTLGYVFFEPYGFVLDGLGFMLLLYVIFTRNKEETLTAEDTYKSQRLDKELERRRVHILDREGTWVCPDCKAINLNEEKVCYTCKRTKPESPRQQS